MIRFATRAVAEIGVTAMQPSRLSVSEHFFKIRIEPGKPVFPSDACRDLAA